MINLENYKDTPDFMTEEGIKTLRSGYLGKDESVKQMYYRVVTSAVNHLEGIRNIDPQLEQRLFDYLYNNWLCLSSPIIMNAGKEKGLPISCYVIPLEDNIYAINHGTTEMAMLTKNGGGVGVSWDNVRAKGTPISFSGAHSEGVIPFMKQYDSTILATSQGSMRRGAASANLSINHGDWEDFIKMRRPEGDENRRCQNLHHCTDIPDSFMETLPVNKQSLHKWAELLKTRMETGESYISFRDNIQKKKPDWYNNYRFSGTNICCVTGDTFILTDKGHIEIKDCIGKKVNVWDGYEFVEVEPVETGNKKCLLVTLNTGITLKVSDNHKFAVQKGDSYELVEIKHLKENTELFKFDYPPVDYLFDIDELRNSVIEMMSKIISNNSLQISKIEEIGNCDTYCFNNPKRGLGCFNGVVTGQSEVLPFLKSDEIFVCDLSSVNISKYDEWKNNPQFIRDIVFFLNGILNEFIDKAKHELGFERAVNFAIRHRSIGIGWLGLHTYLQEKSIPFVSMQHKYLTDIIGKKMWEDGWNASKEFASIYGEPEVMKGHGYANAQLFAIAPTTSNSLISGGISQGVEPIIKNVYNQKSAKGTFIRKNKTLDILVQTKYKLIKETPEYDNFWDSVLENNGSVQHIDWLDDLDKEVFLTFVEINQLELVKLAVQRQKYIDQAQSINLCFPNDVSSEWLNRVHYEAWKQGLKTLYYVRTESPIRGDIASKTFSDCVFCES